MRTDVATAVKIELLIFLNKINLIKLKFIFGKI